MNIINFYSSHILLALLDFRGSKLSCWLCSFRNIARDAFRYWKVFKSQTTYFLFVKQTTGSLYFWAAHLAGPKWGPLASWCCAWLESIGLIAGIGTQVLIFSFWKKKLVICIYMLSFDLNTLNLIWKAYAGSQTLQSIILLCTGTNKDGGYLAPKWLFLCMYIGLTLIWAFLNTFALEVIAFIDIISIWWQVKSSFGFLPAFL